MAPFPRRSKANVPAQVERQEGSASSQEVKSQLPEDYPPEYPPVTAESEEIQQSLPASSRRIKSRSNIGTKVAPLSKEKGILKAEQLPRVGGVCFDKNRQRWIAHWKVNGKYVKNYFPVNNYGFDEARQLAIKCRKDAEVRLELPAIQLRHARSAPAVCKDPSMKSALRQPPVVFYDEQTKRWITVYSVYEDFSVAELGFSSARKKAFECRAAHQTLMHAHLRESFSISSSVKTKSSQEKESPDSSSYANSHSMELSQEAIQLLLLDLKDKCLSNLEETISADQIVNFKNKLQYHLYTVSSANNLSQLQSYLLLFQHHILQRSLPSENSNIEQFELLSNLSSMTQNS